MTARGRTQFAPTVRYGGAVVRWGRERIYPFRWVRNAERMNAFPTVGWTVQEAGPYIFGRRVNVIHRKEMLEHPIITEMERFGYGPHPSRLRRATFPQGKAWVRRKIGEYGEEKAIYIL